MSTKAEKLNPLIDAIPGVSKETTEGVRRLIAEITGITLANLPEEETYAVGDRFTLKRHVPRYLGLQDVPYIIARQSPHTKDKVIAVNLLTGALRATGALVVNDEKKITEDELLDIFDLRRNPRTLRPRLTRTHKSEAL